jgi:hypothetical protein
MAMVAPHRPQPMSPRINKTAFFLSIFLPYKPDEQPLYISKYVFGEKSLQEMRLSGETCLVHPAG